MRAGKQKHVLKFIVGAESQSASGEVTYTWAPFATVWGSVEPISGRELIQADQMQAEASIRVRCRYFKGLTTQHRIEHNGRTLEIISAQNIGDCNREYEILCSESV